MLRFDLSDFPNRNLLMQIICTQFIKKTYKKKYNIKNIWHTAPFDVFRLCWEKIQCSIAGVSRHNGVHLGASLKPLNILVLWHVRRGFERASNWAAMMLGYANLSDSYICDRCDFSRLVFRFWPKFGWRFWPCKYCYFYVYYDMHRASILCMIFDFSKSWFLINFSSNNIIFG